MKQGKVGEIPSNDNLSRKILGVSWCCQPNINTEKKNYSSTTHHEQSEILQPGLPKHSRNSETNGELRLLYHIYHKSKMDGDTNRSISRGADTGSISKFLLNIQNQARRTSPYSSENTSEKSGHLYTNY